MHANIIKVTMKWPSMNSEHFRQKLSSQNLRNDVSEHRDFKLFEGRMPPQPPLWLVSLVPCVIRRRWSKSIPILHTQKVGQFAFSLDRLFWFASYMLQGRPKMVRISLSLSTVFHYRYEITGSHYFKRAEVTMPAANKLRPIVLSRFVLNVICPLVGWFSLP